MKLNGVDPDKRANDISNDTNETKFGDSFDLDIPDSAINEKKEIVDKTPIVKDTAVVKKLISIIAAVLCIVFVIITLASSVMTVKNWFTYRSMMKDIKSTYDIGLIENKVYTKIELKTANIIGYSNGVCTTDLGEIKCSKPTGSVIIVFQDLNGDLRPIGDIDEISNDSVEYVCGEFKAPDNSVVISGDRVKSEYKSYLDDMETATKTHNSMYNCRGYLIFGLVMTLIFGVMFMITHSNLGFKTEANDKETDNVTKNTKDNDKNTTPKDDGNDIDV